MIKMHRGHIDNHIVPGIGKRLVQSITKNDLKKWLNQLPVANQTKNHILRTLRILFELAKDEDIVNENVAREIEPYKTTSDLTKEFGTANTRSALSPSEIKKLLNKDFETDATLWRGYQWATLFTLLLTTGMRVGEALALRWRDVPNPAVTGSTIDIHKAVKNDRSIGMTKTEKSRRSVPLISIGAEYLNGWRLETNYSTDNDLVFPNQSGEVLQRGQFSGIFKDTLAAVGIENSQGKLVPHSLRHTYNTVLLTEGMEPKLVRLVLGHSSQEMTERYNHPTEGSRANNVTAYGESIDKAFSNLFQTSTRLNREYIENSA